MIKKQYNRFELGYFYNFIAHNNSADPEASIADALKYYNATVGKSKNRNAKLNVKWHDKSLYMMFVLRWTQ